LLFLTDAISYQSSVLSIKRRRDGKDSCKLPHSGISSGIEPKNFKKVIALEPRFDRLRARFQTVSGKFS
jgi:hypothetical protein